MALLVFERDAERIEDFLRLLRRRAASRHRLVEPHDGRTRGVCITARQCEDALEFSRLGDGDAHLPRELIDALTRRDRARDQRGQAEAARDDARKFCERADEPLHFARRARQCALHRVERLDVAEGLIDCCL